MPKTKAQNRRACKRYYEKLRFDVIRMLGGACKSCGMSDHRCLQIDHVNGCKGKTKDRYANVEGGKPLLLALRDGKKDSSQYQILCANCNWIKKFEEGESGDYKVRDRSSPLFP